MPTAKRRRIFCRPHCCEKLHPGTACGHRRGARAIAAPSPMNTLSGWRSTRHQGEKYANSLVFFAPGRVTLPRVGPATRHPRALPGIKNPTRPNAVTYRTNRQPDLVNRFEPMRLYYFSKINRRFGLIPFSNLPCTGLPECASHALHRNRTPRWIPATQAVKFKYMSRPVRTLPRRTQDA